MERGNARLKFFDRWVGPLVLLLMAPLRLFRSARLSSTPRTAALLKTAAIGDTLLLSAVITDLFQAGIRVTLFVGSSNADFAKRLDGVAEIVKLPLNSPLAAMRMLRANQYDLFLDFDSWPRISAVFTAVSRARLKIGFRTRGQYRHFAYDRSVEHRNDQHELENYRLILKEAGITATAAPQTLGLPWSAVQGPTVLHMWPSGTKSELKEWPEQRWVSLANELNGPIVLTGGPSDVQRNERFITKLPDEMRSRVSSAAGTPFTATIDLLRSARLLVSVNTGIMHVGAAIGVPTVGLHGPTDPRRWGPVGKRVRSVASSQKGAGRLNLGFEYQDDTNFMTGIEVADVLRACRELLGPGKPQG